MSYRGPSEKPIRWPSNKPVWTVAAFILTLALVCFGMWIRYEQWTPLQRYWLLQYLWTNWTGDKNGRMRLLFIEKLDGRTYWPTDEEVEAGETRMPDGTIVPLQLTEEATQRHYELVLEPRGPYMTEAVRNDLKRIVYKGASASDLFHDVVDMPLWFSGPFLILFLFIAIPNDKERARIRREGQRIRGPEMVSVREFNRRNRGDGIGFLTDERSKLDVLLRRPGRTLRIAFDREAENFIIVSDSGGGKSTL